METSPLTSSLVERKRFDTRKAHAIAPSVWWVGYIDRRQGTSHNPFLLVDGDEAVLINPGSRADEHYRLVRDKVASVIAPARIAHIVVLHHDPDRCASVPLFEKLADRNVRIYAPSQVAASVGYYGCKHPVIGLDGGDSIIFSSGRTLDYHATPDLPSCGSGILHDSRTGTVFCGRMFNCPCDDWNLYAPPDQWKSLAASLPESTGSRKSLHQALNKLERLCPERLCPQQGPIIEDNIERYIETLRAGEVKKIDAD